MLWIFYVRYRFVDQGPYSYPNLSEESNRKKNISIITIHLTKFQKTNDIYNKEIYFKKEKRKLNINITLWGIYGYQFLNLEFCCRKDVSGVRTPPHSCQTS